MAFAQKRQAADNSTRTSQTKSSSKKGKSPSKSAAPIKAKASNKAKPTTQSETSSSVRQQQKDTQRKIKETDEQIKANNRLVTNNLNKLNRLNAQITQCGDSISSLETRIDSLSLQSELIADTIATLQSRIEKMREAFAASLRDARYARHSTSILSLIFSSDNFAQALRRIRTINQFERWRSRRAEEIHSVMGQMTARRHQLDSIAIQLQQSRSIMANRRASLQTHRVEADRLVGELKSKDAELRRVLRQQQQKAAELDARLNRIIAEETRRAQEAERKAAEEARRKAEEEAKRKKSTSQPAAPAENKAQSPSGDMAVNTPAKPAAPAPGATFAQSRGALPSPVDGGYSIVKPFGRQPHPLYPNIVTDNSGIDMLTTPGATIRAVYDGKVSAVFCPDEVTHVIVIRHGDYVSVYANVGSLSVKPNQTVKRGQAIGKVYVDNNDGGRSILHFEIRNATNPGNVKKENPVSWLAR